MLAVQYLANIHDKVPHEDDSPANSSVNIPEPETEEESVESLISKLAAKTKQKIPEIVCYLENDNQ